MGCCRRTPLRLDRRPRRRARIASDVALERERSGATDVELEVVNDADRPITLTLLGEGRSEQNTIPARSARTVSATPGFYSYTATASGCSPCLGTERWDGGDRIRWKFWISTVTVPGGGR